MTVGSLFSGIGGLDLGLEWAGFETKWFCEIEKFPQAVLRKHWPDVPIIEDVRDVTAGNVQRVDVIAGGFPCQDISWAGKGRGIDYDLSEQEGTRSGLWWEMWRVIRDLRPRYVIAENVPALTHRGLDIVLGSLAEIGYDAEWQTVSAASVGAPHIRERVFIVAYRDNGGVEVGRTTDAGRGECGGPGDVRPNMLRVGKEQAGQALAHPMRIGSQGSGGYVNAIGSKEGADRKINRAINVCRQDQPDWFSGPIGQPWPVSFRVGDTTGDWVEAEYSFCGMVDGISEELDKGVNNGKSKKKRSAEELRVLRERDSAETVRGEAGGQERVSEKEVLQSFVRELEGSSNGGPKQKAGEGLPGKQVPPVQRDGSLTGAPHRPQSVQQQSKEHSDAVRFLPHEIALAAVEGGWISVEKDKPWVEVEVSADGSVEGVSDRVGQLKGYGNAVVPQVGYLVGRAVRAHAEENRWWT